MTTEDGNQDTGETPVFSFLINAAIAAFILQILASFFDERYSAAFLIVFLFFDLLIVLFIVVAAIKAR